MYMYKKYIDGLSDYFGFVFKTAKNSLPDAIIKFLNEEIYLL